MISIQRQTVGVHITLVALLLLLWICLVNYYNNNNINSSFWTIQTSTTISTGSSFAISIQPSMHTSPPPPPQQLLHLHKNKCDSICRHLHQQHTVRLQELNDPSTAPVAAIVPRSLSPSWRTRIITRRLSFVPLIQSIVIISGVPQPSWSSGIVQEIIDNDINGGNSHDADFIFYTQLGIYRIGSKLAVTMDLLSNNNLISNKRTNGMKKMMTNNKEPLYYPSFMFGAWNTTIQIYNVFSDTNPTMKQVESKYNDNDDTNNSIEKTMNLFAVEIPVPVVLQGIQYQYFTTIANTIQNQITINLGTGIPETKIIANRAYNLIHAELILFNKILSITSSHKTLHSKLSKDNIITSIPIPNDISNVEWDYRSSTNPTLVSWNDTEYQYERQVVSYDIEVYNNSVFATIEVHHFVIIIASSNQKNSVQKIVFETETITEYHQISDNLVRGKARIMIHLPVDKSNASKNDSKSSSFRIKQLVVTDTDFVMQRIVQSFTTRTNDTIRRPCVETPRGIVQCY